MAFSHEKTYYRLLDVFVLDVPHTVHLQSTSLQ